MRILGANGTVDLLSVKPPAVAGTFYPGDPSSLRRYVDGALADAAPEGADDACAPLPKAIIAPHAGYRYSGPVAARAYAAFRRGASRVRRVVLLGPAHRVGFSGVAVSSAALFATPLGRARVDQPAVSQLLALPGVHRLDRAFDEEHSLEVQLPFIQTVLPQARLVPLLVGQSAHRVVEAVLQRLWGGAETVIVVSSDLSHYLDYPTATSRDRATSKAIVALRGERLGGEDACGCEAIRGLLSSCRRVGLQGRILDLRNSGDTAGGRDRVVGYGAYAFTEAAPEELGQPERSYLLDLARQSIRDHLEGDQSRRTELPGQPLPESLTRPGASFVTLQLEGALRGCIGSLEASMPLLEDVYHNARRAAFEDPRFPPMERAELELTDVSISVLSAAQPMHFSDESDLLRQLRPGVDGLILRDAGRRGTFLPAVWSTLPEPQDFLTNLKRKAGLAPDHWSSTLRVWRYTTQTFG